MTFFVLIFDALMAIASIIMLSLGVAAETVQCVMLGGTLGIIVLIAVVSDNISFPAGLQAVIALLLFFSSLGTDLSHKIIALAVLVAVEIIIMVIWFLFYRKRIKNDVYEEDGE